MMVGTSQLKAWLSVELENHPWMKSVVSQIIPLNDIDMEFKHGQIVTYMIWFLVVIAIARYQKAEIVIL